MGHSGYTAGSRNLQGQLDWAQNLKFARHQNDPTFIAGMQHRESSICAFFWNMARNTLPCPIIAAYQGYMREHFLPTMAPIPTPLASTAGDGTHPHYGSHGTYTVYLAPDSTSPTAPYPPSFEFDAVPLAPPSAVFTVNYARSVF